METVVVAIIGIVAALLAGVLGRLGQAESGAASAGVDPVARVAALVGGVLGLTAVVLVVMVSVGPLHRLEDIGQRLEDLGHVTVKATRILSDFAETPDDTNPADQAKALATEAKAILNGDGPQTMTYASKRWAVGDVVYVNEGLWVTPLHLQGRRDHTSTSENCGIEPGGALTIRGFNEIRQAALLQYTPPGPTTSGTRCPSGTYFFYRVK